ncbi:MAG TPA: alpha-L-rhamnosidase C-terminal domain-containing protein [Candidatus Sulfotelmatobacter sp.]|nr:alpha-L-rhamnosidase C-terminal domain-containing protein [Candidatus Sulfotelmatobacter sp.]
MKYRLISAAITILLGLAAAGYTCQAVDTSDGSGPPIQTSLILPLPQPQTPTPNFGPYEPLHDGAFTGPAIPLSPDPLVRYSWQDPETSDDLQYYLLRPVKVFTDEPGAFAGVKSACGHRCNITVRGTGSLRFDFGVESAAWLEFDSPDMPGGVQMGVSEFTAPAWEHCIAEPTETGGHTYCLKLKNKFDFNGVRFGWIYVRSFDGRPWHITNVRLVCQIKPTNYKGSFSCSDPMLTKIWYTGAYTVKLNLLHKLIGAILMDRGDRVPWTGDDHIAQGAALAAFGNWGDVAQNLEITATNYNRIPSYALYWVLSVMDYYRYTGDRALLIHYIPNIQGKLSQAESWFQDPNIRFYGWDDRTGSGFMDASCDESREAYRMLFIETCRQFAQSMGTVGRNDLQSQYQQTADRYAQMIQSHPDWVSSVGIFAAADAINAGVPTAAQQDILYRRDFANPVERISLSSFNEFFVVQAMARMGWTDQALQTVLEDWGGQINYGATTFLECYWPTWNAIIPQNGPVPSNQAGVTSLCHPWSAGCTTWLTWYVAGIEPTGPGFATVDITPHLGRLLTRVAADAPTPHGIIHWSFDATKGRAKLVIPDGVTARVGIPALDRTIDAIRVNGQMAWDGSYHHVPAIGGAMQQGDQVYFTGVGPGHYTFDIRYTGTTPAYAPQPLVYPDPVNTLGQDDTTSGNWGGVYGKDGYVLLGDDSNRTNREHLPPYVQSVTCRAGKYTRWGQNVGDDRALASNDRNEGARNAAAYFNRCTVLVDIRLKQPHPFRLAAYVVDFDNQHRQEAVDIYNLPDLTLAAPTQAVREYQKGKYVIFDCRDSVRLRFDNISGSNAVVSGIFFDPDSAQQTTEPAKIGQ